MAFEQPLFVSSLYRHANAVGKDDGSVIFLLPERLPFEDRDDTTIHIATGEEYLWEIAQQHYRRRSRAFDLWEVIMQFQPEPIQDASVKVPKGTEILIPSEDYIEDVLEGEQLTEVPEV